MEQKEYHPEHYYKTVKELEQKKATNIRLFYSKGNQLMLTVDVLNAINLLLIPFKKEEKIGFINKKCVIVIQPQYDDIRGKFYTKENIIAVKKGRMWSVIDCTGKELLPFDYSTIQISPDSKLVALQCPFNYSYSWKVLNLTTNETFAKGEYSFIDGFRYGYARVKKNDKWGIINETGKLVLPTEYYSVYDFYNWPAPTTRIQKDNDSQLIDIKLNDL